MLYLGLGRIRVQGLASLTLSRVFLTISKSLIHVFQDGICNHLFYINDP